jgi:hypothetical protein
MRVGERVLLPAVRSAAKDALIIADGFSCREQIAQATDRRALHLAEVLEMASCHGPSGAPGEYPERAYRPNHGRDAALSNRQLLLAGIGVLAVGAAAWAIYRRSENELEPLMRSR